jgi:hypothetical protein
MAKKVEKVSYSLFVMKLYTWGEIHQNTWRKFEKRIKIFGPLE